MEHGLDGSTPLEYAWELGHEEIACIIESDIQLSRRTHESADTQVEC